MPADITNIEQAKTNKTVNTALTFITARSVVEILCFSRYSCKFFIYLVTGKQFRTHLRQLGPCREETAAKTKWVESSGSDSKEVTKLITQDNTTPRTAKAKANKNKKVNMNESVTTFTTVDS